MAEFVITMSLPPFPRRARIVIMRIVIPVFPNFTALDAVGPYEVLRSLPEAQVVFAAAERGIVRADSRVLGLHADAAFDEIDSADILVVPGGFGSRAVMTDEPVLSWIRAIHATTQWTTSVCTGSLILAAAGLLDGLDATTHWSCVDLLEQHGARYTAERVVRRGKIVTGAGVSAGIDMALTLAALVADEDTAKTIQLGIEYDPQPPFDAGSPVKAGPRIVARTGMRSKQPAG
jgi:putative intracellular protease/amidase